MPRYVMTIGVYKKVQTLHISNKRGGIFIHWKMNGGQSSATLHFSHWKSWQQAFPKILNIPRIFGNSVPFLFPNAIAKTSSKLARFSVSTLSQNWIVNKYDTLYKQINEWMRSLFLLFLDLLFYVINSFRVNHYFAILNGSSSWQDRGVAEGSKFRGRGK